MSVRALIGVGSGKTSSSASGQRSANATPTPRTAPEAPANGIAALGSTPERASESTAAPIPQ